MTAQRVEVTYRVTRTPSPSAALQQQTFETMTLQQINEHYGNTVADLCARRTLRSLTFEHTSGSSLRIDWVRA